MIDSARLTAALAGHYAIERELGTGGMALVYLATDLKHHRRVAVKVLRPDLAAVIGADRFLKEIEVTANLQHPHILPLHDSGEADGFLFYVMPLIEGETLRTRLQRERQLGIEEAVEIARAVASALDYAHRHGVIHRDIKPENILLHDGQPLVADFGIALAVSQAGGTRLTETGLSLGTPHYMSPEQAMGDRELDGRTDIYSLGATLYEMLAGEPPYTGSSAQAVVAKVITEKALPVTAHRDTVPPHVGAAIAKALSKLRADRFHSAGEFAQALATPTTTAAWVRPQSAPRGIGRSAVWRVVAAGALVSLVLGFLVGRVWHAAAAAQALERFAIDVEPVTSLTGGTGRDVVLSPDGNTLAFIGSGPLGKQVYVRALADSLPRAVAGTDGAETAFFSPDGREIGFLHLPWLLERVPIEGGTPTVMADSASQFVTWLADGRILYASWGDFLGGPALRLVTPDGHSRELVRSDSMRFLSLSPLPDGWHVLASVSIAHRRATVGAIGGRNAVIVVSVRDGRVQDIGLSGAVKAKYDMGDLIYQRAGGGPLTAAPFDLGQLRVIGEGQVVAPEPGIPGCATMGRQWPFHCVCGRGAPAARPRRPFWPGDDAGGGTARVSPSAVLARRPQGCGGHY